MRRVLIGVGGLCMAAGSAFAGVADIDSVVAAERIFNDFPGSTLSTSTSYPGSVTITESNYGAGGFANKHAAWLSDDSGATAFDFNYGDAVDFKVTMQVTDATDVGAVEAGINTDLFGFGFFGGLPNGEIAAFGGVLPFTTFGSVYSVGDVVDLRLVYRPGSGEGTNSPTVSTIEYLYNNQTTASGWVSSGRIKFGNAEFGFPTAGTLVQKIGVGMQVNNPQATGSAETVFSNFMVSVPTPGAAAVLGLAGVAGLRRRR